MTRKKGRSVVVLFFRVEANKGSKFGPRLPATSNIPGNFRQESCPTSEPAEGPFLTNQGSRDQPYRPLQRWVTSIGRQNELGVEAGDNAGGVSVSASDRDGVDG